MKSRSEILLQICQGFIECVFCFGSSKNFVMRGWIYCGLCHKKIFESKCKPPRGIYVLLPYVKQAFASRFSRFSSVTLNTSTKQLQAENEPKIITWISNQEHIIKGHPRRSAAICQPATLYKLLYTLFAIWYTYLVTISTSRIIESR